MQLRGADDDAEAHERGGADSEGRDELRKTKARRDADARLQHDCETSRKHTQMSRYVTRGSAHA